MVKRRLCLAPTVEENENVRRVPALQRAIEFYKLACTPIFDDAGKPCTDSYQATMLEWGIQKLDEMRMRMPHAGGLVIAHNIEMANYMADLLAIIEGERPFVVHNQITRADQKIKAFKTSTTRWLVSVGMVSEGVDIPRLRVLFTCPMHRNWLFVKLWDVLSEMMGPDGTRAYVVMPAPYF